MRSVLGVHWKDLCWSWNSNTLATWCEELTHLNRPWFSEILRAGGEGDNRGWDGWMASPTQWTWVWVDSGSQWWTGRPDMLHAVHGFTKSQTWLSAWPELNWTLCERDWPNDFSRFPGWGSLCLSSWYVSYTGTCWLLAGVCSSVGMEAFGWALVY